MFLVWVISSIIATFGVTKFSVDVLRNQPTGREILVCVFLHLVAFIPVINTVLSFYVVALTSQRVILEIGDF